MNAPPVVCEQPRYVQMSPDGHPQPVWNLDGEGWWQAPAPPRRHRHWAQTVGSFDGREEVWRCPCGAYGGTGEPWIHLSGQERRVRVPWWRILLQEGMQARQKRGKR